MFTALLPAVISLTNEDLSDLRWGDAAGHIFDLLRGLRRAEVSNDFAAVLRRVGRGEEVVVDRNGQPVAIIKPADEAPRTFSELIALAAQRETEGGTRSRSMTTTPLM